MKIEFAQHLVTPGETIEVGEDEVAVISAEVEEGGKIRVVLAAYLYDEEVF